MTRQILAAAALLVLNSTADAQIAITELLNNPVGSDPEREFFELFNYSDQEVDIANWTIRDEDNDSIVLSESSLLILSGGYVVFTVNKSIMESDHFGGIPQSNIYQYEGFILANGGDEVILADAQGNVIWSLAYTDDDINGAATYLAEDISTTTVWGSQDSPGIDRAGPDPATDTIGYESNSATPDPEATTTQNGDTASPLTGTYTTTGGGPTTDPDFVIQKISPGEAPNTYDISFSSQQGASYTLESSPDLTDESFTTITPVVGTGNSTSVTAPATGARQFFRIRRTGGVVIDP